MPEPAWAGDYQINATLIEVLDFQTTHQGILNPGNIIDRRNLGVETAVVTDFQWEGLKARVRIADEFNRHDGGWRNDGDFDVQELSYDFDLPSQYRLSVGKLTEPWHVGYAFHPLGFFEPELDRDDLSERFKRSHGLPSVIAGYIAPNWDLTLVYSDDFQNARDGFNRGLRQWGARLGYLAENGLEPSLVVQQPERQNVGLGGSLVQVFGQSLEVHGSVFLRQGTRRPLHGDIWKNSQTFYTASPYEEFRKDSRKWYPRSVLGLQWTSDDLLNVVLEWGHDSRGLNDEQWRRWIDLVQYHANGASLGVPSSGVNGNLLYDAETLIKTGTRRDYIFLRLTKGGWDWKPEASVLLGVADGSAIWKGGLTYTVAQSWDAELFGSFSSGHGTSEFGIGPSNASIGLTLRAHF